MTAIVALIIGRGDYCSRLKRVEWNDARAFEHISSMMLKCVSEDDFVISELHVSRPVIANNMGLIDL